MDKKLLHGEGGSMMQTAEEGPYPVAANPKESFSIVRNCLRRANYKHIQYFPKGRARLIGHELSVMRSFLLRNNVALFRQSALYTIYEGFMRDVYPELYSLYRLFFQCKELSRQEFLKWFSQEEVDLLIRDGIISAKNDKCICNYRFSAIDDLLIIGSPDREYDSVDYVYIGADSVRFWNLLKKTCGKSVKDGLEIGCGTGFLSLWMSQIAENVTAADISERALLFTRLNAEINGINNITAKVSDVYSDIEGKYDLIISNPPFVFLPEGCNGRTHAFGGHLGLEIVEKLLIGLDEYLKDDGVSFLIAVAYIKENDINPIYEMIRSIFQGKRYSITLEQLDYLLLQNHYSFYEQHGISCGILYLIRIKRAQSYEVIHLPLRGAARLMECLKIKLLDRTRYKH